MFVSDKNFDAYFIQIVDVLDFYPFTCSGMIFSIDTHAKLNNLCIISLFISFFGVWIV